LPPSSFELLLQGAASPATERTGIEPIDLSKIASAAGRMELRAPNDWAPMNTRVSIGSVVVVPIRRRMMRIHQSPPADTYCSS